MKSLNDFIMESKYQFSNYTNIAMPLVSSPIGYAIMFGTPGNPMEEDNVKLLCKLLNIKFTKIEDSFNDINDDNRIIKAGAIYDSKNNKIIWYNLHKNNIEIVKNFKDIK